MYDIKRLRIARSLTQEQLANAIGVHQTAVSQWEKNKTQPGAAVIPKLLNALNCKIDELYICEEDSKCLKNQY